MTQNENVHKTSGNAGASDVRFPKQRLPRDMIRASRQYSQADMYESNFQLSRLSLLSEITMELINTERLGDVISKTVCTTPLRISPALGVCLAERTPPNEHPSNCHQLNPIELNRAHMNNCCALIRLKVSNC